VSSHDPPLPPGGVERCAECAHRILVGHRGIAPTEVHPGGRRRVDRLKRARESSPRFVRSGCAVAPLQRRAERLTRRFGGRVDGDGSPKVLELGVGVILRGSAARRFDVRLGGLCGRQRFGIPGRDGPEQLRGQCVVGLDGDGRLECRDRSSRRARARL
jgi:hypothetical protein